MKSKLWKQNFGVLAVFKQRNSLLRVFNSKTTTWQLEQNAKDISLLTRPGMVFETIKLVKPGSIFLELGREPNYFHPEYNAPDPRAGMILHVLHEESTGWLWVNDFIQNETRINILGLKEEDDQ